SDAAIIDAYERAYAVAQAVGADGRIEDLPSMRDRQTMARRVRGYVISGKTSHGVAGGPAAAGTATSRERKALATMGRKGGKKAAQRWQDDPDGDYAKSERKRLEKANRQRSFATDENRGRVLAYIASERREGRDPSTREVAESLGLSVRRVQQLRKLLGMSVRRGRPGKSATP
ncbi:MAG: replication initiation protein, partial [Corynebacterium variabile]